MGIRTSHSHSRADNPLTAVLLHPTVTYSSYKVQVQLEVGKIIYNNKQQFPRLQCFAVEDVHGDVLFFLMRHPSVRLSFQWAKCKQSRPLYSCYAVQPWASGNCAPIPLPAEISFTNSASSLQFFLPQLPRAICHSQYRLSWDLTHNSQWTAFRCCKKKN